MNITFVVLASLIASYNKDYVDDDENESKNEDVDENKNKNKNEDYSVSGPPAMIE
jgi:hypothetical protein